MKRVWLILICIGWAGCSSRQPALPVYGQVPDFELTSQTGQDFDRKTLNGKIWVADFIFTTCQGPCPRMSSLMRQVQQAVTMFPKVRLVSFTVDPKRDTPAVLSEYAKRYHAEPDRWVFLTGEQARLHSLKREAFKLGDVDGSLNHSTRLILIDGQSRIRGYYGTSEDSPVAQIVRDIKRLVHETS